MRTALAILLCAFLAAAGVEFHHGKRGVIVGDSAVTLQKGTTRDSIAYRLAETGARERIALTLSVDGPAILRVSDVTYPLNARSKHCAATVRDWLACRVTWSRTGGSAVHITLEPATDAPLKVTNFRASWITAKAMSPLSYSPITAIALVLLCAVPIVWLLHSHYGASQWFLIAVSLTCLALIQPSFTVLLLIFAAAMWRLNMAINALTSPRPRLLFAVLGTSLAFLTAFKVFGPILNSWILATETNRLLLPLGISYFVMRVIDTQLKAYRGQLGSHKFREFLCYFLFVPTVPAGPIETIENFKENRLTRIGRDDVAYGISRIIIGIAKKVLIADAQLRPLIDANVFSVAMDTETAAASTIIILLFANFLFAYVDFSAYSDIAIGLSRLFGYRVIENFNWPILRRNLRIYWQNWHMSLSNWAMRNIYVPVTIGTRNKYVPIYATMIAIGLWHSLGLSWFFWAIHHATGLMLLGWLESWRKGRPLIDMALVGPAVGVLITISFVALGHAFVLFDDVEIALRVYARALGLFGILW